MPETYIAVDQTYSQNRTRYLIARRRIGSETYIVIAECRQSYDRDAMLRLLNGDMAREAMTEIAANAHLRAAE